MGLLSSVRQLLGITAERTATQGADPDGLFEMSTATLTMEANLGFVPTGEAALCFGDVDSTAFRDAVEEVREILTVGESGTVSEFGEDEYGYQWIVLRAEEFEELVTGIHFTSDTLIERQYGSRLQAAVFPFEASERASLPSGDLAYWIYSFRRGEFYPFVPDGAQSRDRSTELKLASVLDGELTVEDDREYWYPLWPDTPGGRPWE
ncbi:hypothetical protein GRX03_06340 [Halovenus sp. WSH3]|uniref:Uncharacterized protein n=1 Tax=Halovenus carboxidivorans TaxID=2692199 RepID=A0A6B0T7E3_9EURY|nr:hypothetical protein [Halovenus carboxidivorans]MXR51222.1 hypothetical protein [Halovenus carboxidivorans]